MTASDHMTVRLLAPEDVEAALDLSISAGWNQTAADWKMLLRLAPGGCFGIEDGGAVRATATLLSFGRELGWVGMVLTDPGYRRRGFARTLLEHVLRTADERGMACLKLDATDQGEELYRGFGFCPEQPVERWWRHGEAGAGSPDAVAHLPAGFDKLDLEAFGVDRSELLSALAERSRIVAVDEGFALLRDGVRAFYAGPVVARNVEAARALVEPCIRGAGVRGCFWDLLPDNRAAIELARELGFEPRRKLMRMARGTARRGRDELVFGIAGFELG